MHRLFWVIAFVIAVLTAAYFISNLFSKWRNSPVIMSLSPKATSLTAFPFPAITICNMNNAKKSIAKSILREAKYNEPNLRRKLLHDVCKFEQYDADASLDNHTVEWNHYLSFMVNVSQPCREMVAACFWHSEQRDCNDLFNAALTDEGICCTFNRVKKNFLFHNNTDSSELNVTYPFDSVDWTPEHGYPDNVSVDDVPWRPWGPGSHLGLTIVLDANLKEYYCSSEVSIGFKVVLHNPVETPKVSAYASALPTGYETRIIFKPDLMTATEQVRYIPQSQRQCLFSQERTLRFYRTYTEHNCAQECEANVTLEFCKCVQFYMPKDSKTRICGRQDAECADSARKVMEQRLIDDRANISSFLLNMANVTNREACGCLPGCYALSFEKTQSNSQLAEKLDIRHDYLAGHDSKYFQTNMAVLHVFVVDTQFTAKQRGELFGFTEFLSNTGGLLGLFIGFSFLSATEAIYFLTLRIWCSKKRRKLPEIPRIKTQAVAPFPFIN
ncbi:pickpocket protein 28-like [Macrosteles quadrilineatus]|uniref:pickpocket protein 28-like n=1 Tax=Macrosteles quadrilineatus TaxID=74068 RepID=UPI0023E1B1E6|nr:pickpocket protein 28-like [Macrosteles quadrilineatus]